MYIPVIMAWHVLKLEMEARQPPDSEIAANILNKQLQTADKGWFSGLEVG
jgi:hypothetical protein